jgi:hypothetical protein
VGTSFQRTPSAAACLGFGRWFGSQSTAHQALRSGVTNSSEPQRRAAWSSLVDAMEQPGYVFAFEQCLWELGHWELDPDRIVSMLEKCPYYLPAVLAATADSTMHSLQLKLAATGSPLLSQLLRLALPLVQGDSICRIQLRLWTSSAEWTRALLGMPAEVRTRTTAAAGAAGTSCCRCCCWLLPSHLLCIFSGLLQVERAVLLHQLALKWTGTGSTCAVIQQQVLPANSHPRQPLPLR